MSDPLFRWQHFSPGPQMPCYSISNLKVTSALFWCLCTKMLSKNKYQNQHLFSLNLACTKDICGSFKDTFMGYPQPRQIAGSQGSGNDIFKSHTSDTDVQPVWELYSKLRTECLAPGHLGSSLTSCVTLGTSAFPCFTFLLFKMEIIIVPSSRLL